MGMGSHPFCLGQELTSYPPHEGQRLLHDCLSHSLYIYVLETERTEGCVCLSTAAVGKASLPPCPPAAPHPYLWSLG